MKKLVLITGATGAIGSVICEHLVKKGCHLLLTARSEQKLASLSARLQKDYNANVTHAPSDFSHPGSFNNLIKKAESDGIDGLVIMPPQPPETTECLPNDVIWESLFKISFIGPVALIRDLISSLSKRKAATIVISGISSKQPLGKYATSNVLRTAWLGQIKTLSDVYGERGLRFNTLSLGGVMTEQLAERIRKETQDKGIALSEALNLRFANVPLRRYAETQEIADMVDFILNSDASKHLTGQNVAFDGGFSRPY
jgi:3-oxoacyl-[acyl-carrier protein] reductase